jgi:hypothetical protein
MSAYTDARSRPGAKLNGADDRQLFAVEFLAQVLEAWAQTNDYESFYFQKNITTGKAEEFPIIGRKRDATDHEPGEEVLGGSIEGNSVQIGLDKMVVDSVFIADIDELITHFELRGPYARQLAESLATVFCQRVAQLHILASRVTTPPYTGGPVPGYAWNAAMATDPNAIENGYFGAKEYIKTRDVGGSLRARLKWAQYLLCARYSGFQGTNPAGLTAAAPFTQDGRRTGEMMPFAGIPTHPTNFMPSTKVITGPSKYQGDFTTTVGHIGTEMAVGILERKAPSVTVVKAPTRLGTLLIASQLHGGGILRPECSYELASAARP